VRTVFFAFPNLPIFLVTTVLTTFFDTHTAMTTVGYGEIIPRTFLGRLITVPLLLFGLLLVALPSFVLGREFAVVWEEMSAGYVHFPILKYRFQKLSTPHSVLDGFTLNMGTLESPVTPYTGRSAAAYGLVPEHEEEEGEDGDDVDDGVTPTLSNHKKGKGKPRQVLFDSESERPSTNIDNNLFQPGGPIRTKELDEETGLAVGAVRGGMTASTSLPNSLSKKEERRKRVDSNAEAHTGAFMGLGGGRGHRRSLSKVDLLGMGGTSVSGNPLSHSLVGETQLSILAKELKVERDALRQEREALRLERESIRLERNELAKERDNLRNRL
jgi:hypothetical protein